MLGAFDLEYFGRAYLGHYFTTPAPAFHADLDDIWLQGVMKGMNPTEHAKEISRAKGCRRAIEAPRGHAKSTTFTFKDDLHAALYGYKHYIIILSDSSEQAEGFLTDIKDELEENAALREDFGELIGNVWKSSVALLANGTKIEAIGSGKKIRGRRHKQWRPDLIVCDDLENDENVATKEQRTKLLNWYDKAVSECGDTYTDIVYIGTLLHFDSLLANVCRKAEYKSVKYQGVLSWAVNTDLWDAWEQLYTNLADPEHEQTARAFFEANRADMLEGTAVLWKEKNDYYALMCKRVNIGPAAFNSEIQNNPIDPSTCTFQEEWFDYWDDEGKTPPNFADPRFLFVGANDPQFGQEQAGGHQQHLRSGKRPDHRRRLCGHRGRGPAPSGPDHRGRAGSQPEAQARVPPPLLPLRRGDGAVSGLLRGGHAAESGQVRGIPPHRGDQLHTEQGRPHPLPPAVCQKRLYQIQQEAQGSPSADEGISHGPE